MLSYICCRVYVVVNVLLSICRCRCVVVGSVLYRRCCLYVVVCLLSSMCCCIMVVYKHYICVCRSSLLYILYTCCVDVVV